MILFVVSVLVELATLARSCVDLGGWLSRRKCHDVGTTAITTGRFYDRITYTARK